MLEQRRDASVGSAVRRESDDDERARVDVVRQRLVEDGSLEHLETLGAKRVTAQIASHVRKHGETSLAAEPSDGGPRISTAEDERAFEVGHVAMVRSSTMLDIAIMVAVLGGGAFAFKLLTSKGDREADEIWTTAARRVGGEVEITEGRLLRATERRIRLTVEGVPLVVRTGQDTLHVNTHAYYTRVSAGPLPSAGTTRIHGSKRDLVRKLSKRLGIGELPTGHADFDDAVHVSGSPMGVVLAFFDAPTRGLVVDSEAGFDLDDAFVVVQREGVPGSSAPLIEMTRLAERLVQRWCALLRGPARLAAHLALAVDEAWEVGRGTGRVATGVHRSRNVALSLRFEDETALSILSLDYPGTAEWTMERDENDRFTIAGEPPHAVRAFASAAPESLLGMRAIGGALELAFAGLAPDHAEVAASLDALLDATAPLAPYR